MSVSHYSGPVMHITLKLERYTGNDFPTITSVSQKTEYHVS